MHGGVSKMVAKNFLSALRRLILSLVAVLACATAQAQTWTLESSIKQATTVAPELRAAEAEVNVRAAELKQAGAWPNPTVDLRADDRLGQEDGRGGTSLTEIALSQPLPLRRLARQRAMAGANLEGARANRRYQQLLLEREAADVFHALQTAAARRELAAERLRLVGSPSAEKGKAGTDRLVRYLPPLERRRLTILNEEAHQAVAAAEGEYQKALIDFRALLALPPETVAEPAQLVPPAAPVSFEILVRALDTHPALAAAQNEAEAAQAGIAVAQTQRFADPVLNLFRERDYLAGERRDVNGVGLSVQIPIWNTNNGAVAKARGEVERAQARLAALKRDARSRLEQSHAQLLRLLEQTERVRTNLLEPAREVYTLTRRGFASGELNILSLVDANNTYFDALARYLELQQESARAAAELRLASGVSVFNASLEAAP